MAATLDNLIILDCQWTYSRVVARRNAGIGDFYFWNIDGLTVVDRVNLTNSLATSSCLDVDRTHKVLHIPSLVGRFCR